MTDLGVALEQVQQPANVKDVRDLISRQRPQIERLIGAQAERLLRTYETECQRNPKLIECEPHSMLGALMLCAQLGLEFGPLGLAYAVPFKRKGVAVVEFIVGYKGYIQLAHNSGQVKEIVARTVYANEEWDYYESETGDHYKHRPLPPDERGDARLWFARARFKSGGTVVQPIYPEDAERAKQASPSGSKNVGPWADHYDAMARKTAVRRLAPYLPLVPLVAQAEQADETLPIYEETTDEDATIRTADDA